MAVGAGVRLEARDLKAIFGAFIEAMDQLPPDTIAGWLDSEGELRLAPDLGRKLRTAQCVTDTLVDIRRAHREVAEH